MSSLLSKKDRLMGQTQSSEDQAFTQRGAGITGGGGVGKRTLPRIPPDAVRSHPDDYTFIEVGCSCHAVLGPRRMLIGSV